QRAATVSSRRIDALRQYGNPWRRADDARNQREPQFRREVPLHRERSRLGLAETDQRLQEGHGVTEGIGAEEDPADHHDADRVYASHESAPDNGDRTGRGEFARTAIIATSDHTLGDEKRSVPQA